MKPQTFPAMYNEKPNWQNLAKSKCPKCNKDFTRGLSVESNMQVTTYTHNCGFKIREQRYKEIVSDIVNGRLEKVSHDEDEYA